MTVLGYQRSVHNAGDKSEHWGAMVAHVEVIHGGMLRWKGVRWQNLEAGLSLDDEHAVEVRFVVKFKSADEVQVTVPASCTTRIPRCACRGLRGRN